MQRILSLIIASLALVFATGCTQIETGNVGVKKFTGQVDPTPLPAGFHMTWFSSVTEVIAKEVPLQLADMKPQTSDKITLADLDVDIYVQIDPGKAAEIFTKWPGDMTRVNKEDEVALGLNFVTRQAREAIYNSVSTRSSATVHTERTGIAADVVKTLQADLDASAGKGLFFVRSANVRNLVTDPALEANIKAAANREYEIKSKEKEKQLAALEADRQRIEAQGEADAIRIKADAISKQGGAEYVQLQAIQKWNGALPTTNAGGAVPFISLK